MDTGAPEVGKTTALWKPIAIRAAVGGAAFGVVVVIGAAVAMYVANRPKEWNERALKVVHSEGHPLGKMNRNLEVEGSGIAFDVDIQNTTAADITLAQDLNVLSQTRGTHALRGTVLKLPSTHFIPAHHTVSVSLDASELCVANYDPRKCHESY